MIVSCKCLNVTIDSKNEEFQTVDISNLGLSSLERTDPFFKEKIAPVDLTRISKEQGSLVQVRNVGNWIIHQCLNCLVNTHAIHRERGAACVLANCELLTNPDDIALLKTSNKYSTVFRLLVNDSTADHALTKPMGKFTVSQVEGPKQAALSALQLQLSEAIQQEVSRVEEKVRFFSEHQYAALEEFREKAHNDHRALIRLLSESKDNAMPATTPMTVESSLKMQPPLADEKSIPPLHLSTSVPHLPFTVISPIPLNPVPICGSAVAASPNNREQMPREPLVANKFTKSTTPISNELAGANKTEKRPVKSRLFSNMSGSNKTEGSLDAEGLFDLEGMEDVGAEVFQSEEENDTDDSGSHDEGIHIPRSCSDQYNLAKSLPMKVPTFLSALRTGEDEDERKQPRDPMDIAASIKALARSVHGDANVFGELPRPRFSTQI